MVDPEDDPSGWVNPAALAGWRSAAAQAPQPPGSGWTVPAQPAAPGFMPGRPLRSLAWTTACGIAAVMLLRLATGAIDVGLAATGHGALAGASGSAPAALLTTLGLVEIPVYLFAGIAFICWLYRARTNVDAWQARGLRWSSGWAIGGWFIPLGNLVIPKQVVDEVRGASAAPGLGAPVGAGSTPLIWAWWLCYLLGDILSSCGGIARDNTAVIGAFASLLLLAAGALAIQVIRDITALQEGRLGGG